MSATGTDTLDLSICRQEKVTDRDRNALYELHALYFKNVERDRFASDLSEKDWVILLRDRNSVFGFSTLQLVEKERSDRPVTYLFSGDTIVHPDYWGSNALAPAFGHFVLAAMEWCKTSSLYWYLITKGYRTYRFLPLYFREFYPRHDAETPPWAKELIDYLGTKKFGSAFHPEKGVISFDDPRDRLRGDLLRVPAGKERNPHVRFFLERNPGYTQGDELACIAPLTPDNINSHFMRVVRGRSVRWEL